ncbi:sulfoxide reductase catalytic subunit YedY [Sulfurospirillum diekertiae]|uniref:Protein-methionine-sulfoxide reductase catalytic subunit MsrP n=1 Tax=Sulfurospirillum diekertiae TaxID=1854492 RepID=A0A290HQL9_9BACT|nr:protein-methionine-sulfoxide reductase catalytic subunit MsrP [Sulfurospirillum diekertiae]ATB70008.1 sulfoxide reductase catalytic subunit YedY [Sulfurospirillum diekertiae]
MLITPEALFEARRYFLKLGAGALVSSAAISQLLADLPPDMSLHYTPDANPLKLSPNTLEQITNYVNFYEFSTDKTAPVKLSQKMKTTPWDVHFSGELKNVQTMEVDDLIAKFGLEERIYRFRCVEGWSMVVPWIGFPLSKLLDSLEPNAKAKYVKFTTRHDPSLFPDQAKGIFSSIPYPYVEGLRMDEARHPLTFVAVGMYGKRLLPQNGAPIRLVVPWKYGFKSIKSLDKIECVEKEPLNTWQAIDAKEYGFYANVNPEVDHPRWTQSKERLLGKLTKQATLPFNGYDKEVASLYAGMDLRKFF